MAFKKNNFRKQLKTNKKINIIDENNNLEYLLDKFDELSNKFEKIYTELDNIIIDGIIDNIQINTNNLEEQNKFEKLLGGLDNNIRLIQNNIDSLNVDCQRLHRHLKRDIYENDKYEIVNEE